MPPLEIANVLQPLVDVCHSILLFWHDLVGSWGWSIILLTFTIRLVILPLTFKSVTSMQKLQVLQPEMKKLQERYKEDKQRLNQEMMAFYKENKVNPLGSCLPLLLQIPFFISLFSLLRSDRFNEDLKGPMGMLDPSFGPIDDLSMKATGIVLIVMIVLYVGTQLIASLITTVGGDKNQQRIMMALPFVFVIPIISFPSGLIVYWITTNVWTIGQQLVVKKLYPKPTVSKADDKKDVAASAPARGKPKPAVAAAASGGSGDGGSGSTSSGGSTPPPAPRKKKKRSGRRR